MNKGYNKAWNNTSTDHGKIEDHIEQESTPWLVPNEESLRILRFHQ